MSFGSRLRALRDERGMTQRQLADAVGLSQQAVAAYELDTREPGWAAIEALAGALGVDCTAFRDTAGPPPGAGKPAGKGAAKRKGP